MELNRTLNAHLGRRIALLREQKGLSRVALAAVLSVSEDHVRRYERGINGVPSKLLRKVADRLGVPVRYFFDEMPTAEVIRLEEHR